MFHKFTVSVSKTDNSINRSDCNDYEKQNYSIWPFKQQGSSFVETEHWYQYRVPLWWGKAVVWLFPVSHTLQRGSYPLYHADLSRAFQKLLDKGEIYSYLDELEIKTIDAVDRQVNFGKNSSKEYQIAVEKGDIVTQAGLLNAWESMAREIIYDCMICV